MTQLVLVFAAPVKQPLSQNVALRQTGYLNRRAMTPWRDRVKQVLEEPKYRWQLLERQETPVPITVQVGIPFPDQRGRDPHNYTGTVVKACIDGIVRAKYVPDDVPEWVTVLDPELYVGTMATVTLTDREPREIHQQHPRPTSRNVHDDCPSCTTWGTVDVHGYDPD